MIELLYFASQIQCGVNGELLNIQVDVYHNQELIKTMAVNEKVLLEVDSVTDLEFEYTAIDNNTDCGLSIPSELVLAPDDAVPTMAGAYDQQSIQSMLDVLYDYEELFLVELGTEDKNSSVYDLQDVVIKVNNDPTLGMFAD